MSARHREFIKPKWAWTVERILASCAVGALGRQCWATPQEILRPLLPAIGLLVSLLLALLRCCRFLSGAEGESPQSRPYDECAAFGVAALGAVVHLVIVLSTRQEAHPACFFALATGLAAMIVITLNGHRSQKGHAASLLSLISPWLTAIKLGVLGDWLMARLRARGGFAAGDQSMVSLVTLAVVASLLALRRWGATTRYRGGGTYPPPQSARGGLTLVTSGVIWGSYIGPGILLGLTITTGQAYLAFMAWILLLLGEGLLYYQLSQ